ncbi:anti-sigma factor RsbA family regulatory protein [Microbispora sp. NPDC088329]|uniref:anti-sigma factor RsbA family regulatory protein n=1 Tax=Microbispora sp. NPDC088329 TaxID=3154869 RepID=UPI00341F8A65
MTGLEHIGLLYGSEDEYVTGCVAFLRQALKAGEPALVAVPGGGGELVRADLGHDAERVTFRDMSVVGRNPGRIIPSVLLAFQRAHPGRRVWIIGESMWNGRSDLEHPACVQDEALVNVVFADSEAAILCPYDTVGLGAEAIRDAHRTHPVVRDRNGTFQSPAYADPLATAAACDLPLPAPPPHAAVFRFTGLRALPELRAFASAGAEAAGLEPRRLADMVIAVNELATNTGEHTDGPGTLALWAERGTLVCQVDDGGRLDPLAGRVPPPDHAAHGRGLLVVHELADLVRIHRHERGTSIRIHFDLPGRRAACTSRPPVTR